MSYVGIVILNYNTAALLRQCLQSLQAARNNVPYSVFVIDNASAENDAASAKAAFTSFEAVHKGKYDRYAVNEQNNGFPGGCNQGIRYFMEKPEITHICLLNADTLVGDAWLDRLSSCKADIAGPVSNAGGGEQTVFCSLPRQEELLQAARLSAQRRILRFGGLIADTDMVVFFAVLLARGTVERLGLLDERFAPGCYEDDDYCMRAKEAGMRVVIDRGCYVHHLGSASFSSVEGGFDSLLAKNAKKFEEKWKCARRDRSELLVKSVQDDLNYMARGAGAQDEAQTYAAEALEGLRRSVRALTDAYAARAQADRMNAVCGYPEIPVRAILRQVLFKVKRKILSVPQIHQRYYDKRAVDETQMSRLLERIANKKRTGGSCVAVLAPYFEERTLSRQEGYMRKVASCDREILFGTLRVYLYESPYYRVDGLRIRYVDSEHVYVLYNANYACHRQALKEIARACGVCYVHSALRLVPVDGASRPERYIDIFSDPEILRIFDVHGAVPEEAQYLGMEKEAAYALRAERYLCENADCIVTLTEAMGRHLQAKYPDMRAKEILLPVFNSDIGVQLEKSPGRTTVVFAGGVQKWQNIEAMQDAVRRCPAAVDYRFFVADKAAFLTKWGEAPLPENVRVDTVAPRELNRQYESCHYGFLLRDDTPLNRVACPTKMIEYLKYGIVPILFSSCIGDFSALGLEYVAYDDLLSGALPDEKKRETMAAKNSGILDVLYNDYSKGVDRLRTRMLGGKPE
ncbi:MAG: glycosyltransferase [Oscillospiraceae bacterium]|nr:glycosyltransferase [Oscillospiraceae bacterium]